MIEVRIDTSELRELYALIGRNIAGASSEPPGRTGPSGAATGAFTAPPREAEGIDDRAGETQASPTFDAPTRERSLVSDSPIFTLAGLRAPSSGPLSFPAAPLAADTASGSEAPAQGDGEREGVALRDEPGPGRSNASVRPDASSRTVPVQRSAAALDASPRPTEADGTGSASLRSEDRPPATIRSSPTSVEGEGAEAVRLRADGRSSPLAGVVDALGRRDPVALASSAVLERAAGSDIPGAATRRTASDEAHAAAIGPLRPAAEGAAAAVPSASADAARDGAPNVASLSREVEAFLQSSGWADRSGAGQPERAGVIASFVLNAAMIPGWPPPRPIEPAAFSRQVALPTAGAALASDEMEAGLLMLKALRDPAVVAALLAALATQRRRRRILAILALLTTNLRALLSLWAAEIAALPPAAAPGVPARERLALR